jgi:hypothetical protein
MGQFADLGLRTRKIAICGPKFFADSYFFKFAKYNVKGIVQPFELGGVTRLIRSAVKICMAGNLKKEILMVQSHERSSKLICAA